MQCTFSRGQALVASANKYKFLTAVHCGYATFLSYQLKNVA